MQKTRIEWADFTINPVKGLCPMACSYCYARRMYRRFHWDPTIRYDDWAWQEGKYIPPGSKVFVGSTMELFGPWIKERWLEVIFEYCATCPKVTFIFLTKKPECLERWSPFPDNCWIGVSVTDRFKFHNANFWIPHIEAKVKFISFEPLLDDAGQAMYGMNLINFKHINWIIIGQQTPAHKKTEPKIEWIKEIVQAADKSGIPVFLKDNLKPLLDKSSNIAGLTKYGCGLPRQEFPK